MITLTSLKHPAMQKKIGVAMVTAIKQGHSSYIDNARGKKIIRVSFEQSRRHIKEVSTTTSLRVFCGSGRDITTEVIKSLRS